MKWILKFRRKAAPEGEGCVCITVRCPEEALQGEKEASCMELERNSGEPWICVGAVRLPSREDRHDD